MSKKGPDSKDILEIEQIRRFIELMEEHNLSELELRQDNQCIQLKRGFRPEAASLPDFSQVPASATDPPGGAQLSTTPARETPENISYITSPMVGTFYTQRSPESDPFIQVGDHVGPETTVCIIEAMKVFNEIPAGISGRVAAVLVENEEPVEFGKPLFKVEKHAE